MDWWAITPTGRFKPTYAIEWSPSGFVRAKHDSETEWQMCACSHAKYAETIGESLLTKGEYYGKVQKA